MKNTVIAKALIRRSSDGKYLVLTSSKWPERPDRSQRPDLPGGFVEAGETPEVGCNREILEEAGLKVDPQSMTIVQAETFLPPDGKASITRIVYLAEVEGSPKVTLSWEHESYEWLSGDEVKQLDIREPYPRIFSYLHKIGILC